MLFTRPNSLKLHVIFYQMVVMVAMHNILYISFLFFSFLFKKKNSKCNTLQRKLSPENIYSHYNKWSHTHIYIWNITNNNNNNNKHSKQKRGEQAIHLVLVWKSFSSCLLGNPQVLLDKPGHNNQLHIITYFQCKSPWINHHCRRLCIYKRIWNNQLYLLVAKTKFINKH